MATLAEIRKQYPQYRDLSDEQLADGLYKRFYADMPREEFNKKVGLRPSEPFANRMARQISSAVPGADRIKAVAGAGIDYLSGEEGTFGENYDRRLKREQALTNEANRDMGVGDVLAKTAGYTGGGLAMAGTKMLQSALPAGASLWEVAKEGVRIGVPVGAAQGYLDSQADTAGGRLADTATGGVGGAVIGAAAPYVIAAPGAVRNALMRGTERVTGTTPPQRNAMLQARQEMEAAGIPADDVFAPAIRPDGSRTAESLAGSLAGGPVREAAGRNALLVEQALQRDLQAAGGAGGRQGGEDAQNFLRRELFERRIPPQNLETMDRAALDRIGARMPDPDDPGTMIMGGQPRYTYKDQFGAAYEGVRRDIPPTVRTVAGSGQSEVGALMEELRRELRSRGLLRGDDANMPIFRSPAADQFRRELARRIPADMIETLYSRRPVSVHDMRHLRTQARELADVPPNERTWDTAFLQRFESALNNDMYGVLTRSPNLSRAGIRMHEIDQAYAEHKRGLVAPLQRVFGERVTPEQAMTRLVEAAGTGNGANMQMLRSFYRTHRDKGSSEQATAALVAQMSEGGLQNFLTGMRNLSPEARQLMQQRAPQLMGAIQRFERVAGRLEPYMRIGRNPGLDASRVPNMAVAGSLLSNIWLGLGTFAGQAVMARVLSSPAYLNWLTRAARARSPAQINQMLPQLAAIAEGDAEVGQAILQSVGEAIRPEKAQALFLGENSKTADREALARARQMEKQGVDRDTIWKETGWGKDKKGKWFYESDDRDFAVADDLETGKPRNFNSAVRHPELGPAYGDQIDRASVIAADPFPFPDSQAAYMPKQRNVVDPRIFVRGNKSGRDLSGDVLHETQHLVDDIEGANLAKADQRRFYDNRSEEVRARNAERRRDWSPEERRALPPWASQDVPDAEQDRRNGRPAGIMKLGGPMSHLRDNRNASGEWREPHVNPGMEIAPGDPRGRGLQWPATEDREGQRVLSDQNSIVDTESLPEMQREAQAQPRNISFRGENKDAMGRPTMGAQAIEHLLSKPMSVNQQQQTLQDIAPELVPDFDALQALLKKHYPNASSGASPLGYDLDPPDDAPEEIKALAGRIMRDLMRLRGR